MRKLLNAYSWIVLIGGIISGLIFSILLNINEVVDMRGRTETEFSFGGFLATFILITFGVLITFSVLRIILEIDEKVSIIHASLPQKSKEKSSNDMQYW